MEAQSIPTDETETGQEPEPEASEPRKERKPTLYVVLVQEDDGTLGPLSDPQSGSIREFEGFRRAELLADLVEKEEVEYGEDGKTPWVYIVPARGFQKLRASEGVPVKPPPEIEGA